VVNVTYYRLINICLLATFGWFEDTTSVCIWGTRKGVSRILGLVPMLKIISVTVAGVYRQLYRHCSEPLEPMAPVDSAAWALDRETVHIYGGTQEPEPEQCGRTLRLVESPLDFRI
jgi:hypothetical protein